jgi:aconitate hydratase
VLSGNRNFEGRVHAQVKANYLASPPLVVAYALAGSVLRDIATEPLGMGKDGKPVYLRDIWPTTGRSPTRSATRSHAEMYRSRYADVFKGDADWQRMGGSAGMTYKWNDGSTYVKNPPYFEGMSKESRRLLGHRGARLLALLGDSITTDHISPAGSIKKNSPAGEYLLERQVRRRTSTSTARAAATTR